MKRPDPYNRKNIFLFTDGTFCKLKRNQCFFCFFFVAKAAQSVQEI